MEQPPSPKSSDDQSSDPQQTDPDIPSQAHKESPLQKPNEEVPTTTKRYKLNSKESRDKGRQQMNDQITNYEQMMLKLGIKKREVDAKVKQLFESIKQVIRDTSEDEFFGTVLSEVETHPIEWLWQGRIPLGKITILDGDPGVGKSLIAINIAACISAGRPMPDGTPGIQGGVILIAPEDSSADTIKPRLEAAGGDLTQVLLLNTMEIFDVKRRGVYDYPFSLSRDMQDLEIIINRRNAKLVVLDPLMAVLGREVSASSDQDIREVLTPLAQLAERTKCAILIIRHLNKGNSSNSLYRGAGSIGIIGAARMGLIVVRDPNDEQRCILATTKNNLSKHASHLIYQIVENEQRIPSTQWLGEIHDTLSNLIRPPKNISFERQEIHKVLRQTKSPLEPKEIAERTGQKIESVRVVLSRMYENGEIARPYRGKYTSLDHVSITEINVNMINDKSETSVRSVINDINEINDINDTNDTNPA
jgi:archaellum biogenesis ATPase FlaH